MKYLFEIKIKSGVTVEQYVEAWKKGSELIQKQSGAKGTRLYRKIGEPDRLLAIADWESKEARDVAMANLRESGEDIQKIWRDHNNFGELIKIGAFEEAEWEVLPAN